MAKVQPVFQNPFEAFNPLTKIDEYLFATAHRFCNARTKSRDREARRRGAPARRPVARRSRRPLLARALGRPAAARRRGARADPVAKADRRRRAGVDGRRLAPDVDRQPLPRPCATSSRSRSSTSPTISRPPTTSPTASSSCDAARSSRRRRPHRARQPHAPLFDRAQERGAAARSRARLRDDSRPRISKSPAGVAGGAQNSALCRSVSARTARPRSALRPSC